MYWISNLWIPSYFNIWCTLITYVKSIYKVWNITYVEKSVLPICVVNLTNFEVKRKLLLGIMYSLSRDINALSLQQDTSNIFFWCSSCMLKGTYYTKPFVKNDIVSCWNILPKIFANTIIIFFNICCNIRSRS